MKSLFKKITLIFVLTMVLLSGVNFDVLKNNGKINLSILVQTVSAQDANSTAIQPGAKPKTSTGSATPAPAAGKGVWDGVLFGIDFLVGTATLKDFAKTTVSLYIVSNVQAFLVAASAGILDAALVLSIQNFSGIASNSGVEIAWEFFRNLINISFVFILLYIAISTIIGSIGPKAKSTVASVIIAALLINFSLFFTRIMIDASNMVAVALYNHTGSIMGRLGTDLMQGMKLQALFNLANITATGQSGTLWLLTLSIVLNFVLIWTYLSVAFLFIGRMIMLLILMSLSPIAFLGSAIPGLGAKASAWWAEFVNQLLIAPAFMFLLIIVYGLLDKSKQINDITNSIFDNNTAYTGNFRIGPLVFYILLITILLTGVKLVKKLSGTVGDIAEKATKAAFAAAAIAVTGGVAIAAGTTAAVGAAARAGTVLTRAQAARGVMGNLAKDVFTGDISKRRGIYGTAGRFAREKIIGTVKDVSYGKVDLGKLQKNYNQSQKDEEERIMKEAEAIGPHKAEKSKETYTKIENNINQQVEKVSPGLVKKAKDSNEAVEGLQKSIDKLEEQIGKKKTEYEAIDGSNPKGALDKNEKLTEIGKIEKEREEARQKLQKIKPDSEANAKLLEVAQNKIAEQMGTSMKEVADAISKADADITKGLSARNQFAAEIGRGGFGTSTLSGKKAKEVATNVRAMQGEYKSKKDADSIWRQAAKDAGYIKDDEGEEKSGKKEEKPPAAEAPKA